MKSRTLKAILSIGLLAAPEIPIHAAQTKTQQAHRQGGRRRGGAGRRVGIGAAGGAAAGAVIGRVLGGAAIGGALGAGGAALFHRRQRRRGR